MIESLVLQGVASFGDSPVSLEGLSQINFFYGANGCGKTTIGRVISDASKFNSCRVVWKGGTPLQTLVYNRDFVEENFSESAELKGVFTLGEQNVEILAKISKLKGETDSLVNKRDKLNLFLKGPDGTSGKEGELKVHEDSFRDHCWEQKTKYDERFKEAFEGFRNSAEKFKAKVLHERDANKGEACELTSLEARAETIFGATPSQEAMLPAFDGGSLVAYEKDAILKKKVIGANDVDIAAMIKVLANSDWIREGRKYFEQNDSQCPFCQQKTPEAFGDSLKKYFNESFESDSDAIDKLCGDYRDEALALQQQIVAICESPSRFIDIEKVELEQQLFDSLVALNLQHLTSKAKEPSAVVQLETLSTVVKAIAQLVDDANIQITTHNKTVANLAQERKQLTADVWKYVLTELQGSLETYDVNRIAVQKAIDRIREQVADCNTAHSQRIVEIRELEKKITSTQPTIDGINSLLTSFGFTGFSLAAAADGKSYRLVRSDGSDAKMTLSEGEKTFVTFLYFYYLLKGSNSQSGATQNRVVVFDDPVSSLDSDVLFIVGSLIKGVFDNARSKDDQIKQVFVFTHNVYFHKEVTFNPRRVNDAMNEETFWVVRKAEANSLVESHTSNPIKTSYELLWSEVRSQAPSRHTIQNTLRRILENYFKILGGVDPDEICGLFDGKEKLICRSLFSWVNDGSHYAHDDLYVSIDDGMVQGYLLVFKKIFEKSRHIAHYDMMMRGAHNGVLPEESPVDTAA